jgi:GTPase-associated protein 1, N-terminal domain type 1
MAEPLQIEQALFGYEDGHRLLACSVEIPPEAERAILPLSDGPDLQVAVPTEGYISAYPLPLGERFVLSRTWPAPEMRRPGCVWTQVLMISSADLNSREGLSELAAYFRRPEGPAPDLATYRQPVVFQSSSTTLRGASGWSNEELFLWLYTKQDPVVVFSEDHANSECQMLAIWDQQWPELRRSFSFTSIATTREILGRPFDLRAVSEPDPVLFRSLGAEVHPANQPATRPEGWLALVAQDLEVPGELRRVLWRYGVEAGGDRTAFASIARLYAACFERKDSSMQAANQLLRLTAEAFPTSDQMRCLKRDLFGTAKRGVRPDGRLFWVGSDAAMLGALVASEDQVALDPEDLKLTERLTGLWNEDRSAALGLLQACAESPTSPLAAAALETLLPLGSAAPELVAKDAPAAVPLAIDRDPSFAANPVVWSASGREMDERWSAIDSIPFLGKARKGIVRAMLGADTPAVIGPAFSRWGTAMVGDLLEIAGERSAPRLSEGWIELLRAQPGATAQWFASRKEPPGLVQLALVAETANPEQIAQLQRPLRPWLKLVDSGGGGRARLSPNQLAFLFRLGLVSREPSAAPLLLGTFQALHELDERSGRRQELEAELGSQANAANGKAGQLSPLVVALADRWRQEGWALSSLVESVDDHLLVSEILRAYLRSKKGTKAVEKYLDSVPKNRRAKLRAALPELKNHDEKSKHSTTK